MPQQPVNILHELIHLFRFRPVAIRADMPVFIDEQYPAAMVESAGCGGVLLGDAHIVIGNFVDIVLVAGDETPAFRADPQVPGVDFQPAYGIPLGVDGVGEEHQPGLVLVFVVNAQHLLFHFGADGRAGGEEKIRYVDLAFEGGVGDHLAILVDKGKVGDLVVDGVFALYVVVADNGQGLLLRLRGVAGKGYKSYGNKNPVSHG